MNRFVFRRQLARNVCSVRSLVVVAMSVMLMAVQYWTTYHAGYRIRESAPSLLKDVMLFNQYGSASTLYLYLLPFFAALMGGSVWAVEERSGRLLNMLPREGRSALLHTSMLSGFVLGGLGGVLPLIVNLLVSAVRTPQLSFIEGTSADENGMMLPKYVLIDSSSWAYPLYRMSQPLLIAVILLLVFVLSGAFALLALGSSLFIRRRHVELLVPFVASLVWWMLPALTGGLVPDEWSQIIFLNFSHWDAPGTAWRNYLGMLLMTVGMTVCSLVLARVKEARDVL
ncbi:hypothetical protein DSM100688_1412 [Bifidobacterium ramosum]|uniref:Uncharacterized protein n=1 Tax=Bifidobacterium ramosum TaxID=1798158 RepID=A0A6L4X016_9BIFI|nr:ABC transporter permease [Bifidobacterium scaligerum]KAB8287626.1 hypothetical protein DSM100688_1412 [Bifidobacterium ramosum]